MIKMQQIGSPSKFLSSITVKCFYFVVVFICAIQPFPNITFSNTIRPSPFMPIFLPTFSPRSTMSGRGKLLFTLQPEWIWFKFNSVILLFLPFQFLQHCHDFFPNQRFPNWITHVKKYFIFSSVSPIKYKFLGPYVIQHVPIPFHKTRPISFS